MCCVCRKRQEKNALFRVTGTAEEEAALDEKGYMPGRGVYLCRDRNCIGTAKKRSACERSLKLPANPALYEILEDMIGTG